MLYIVYCKDKPNHVNKRLDNYDAHKAYLGGNPINFLMSGPCVDEGDRETMIGSFFLVEAENREQVEEFNRNDPFYKAEIWESIHIQAFSKRVDNISAA